MSASSPARVSIRHPHNYNGVRRSLDQETLDYYGIPNEDESVHKPRPPPKSATSSPAISVNPNPPPRPSRANTATLDDEFEDLYDEPVPAPEMLSPKELPAAPLPTPSAFGTRSRSGTGTAKGKKSAHTLLTLCPRLFDRAEKTGNIDAIRPSPPHTRRLQLVHGRVHRSAQGMAAAAFRFRHLPPRTGAPMAPWPLAMSGTR
ncbi:hypothetical protein AG1IA_02496 [Rhizoctonia solani AG-1 IA]|uniref:Uncharacterized protein n=1 Tax=Thanatephorus cucumeris (strain AG1-IA) TaxID=983506 RepID=L8WZP9_THACA|nr:hypothetical protein AG1IA_02496 [Rhizoctonia solani AG-1 IA]